MQILYLKMQILLHLTFLTILNYFNLLYQIFVPCLLVFDTALNNNNNNNKCCINNIRDLQGTDTADTPDTPKFQVNKNWKGV